MYIKDILNTCIKIEPGHLKGNADANLEANINDCYGRQRHLVIFGRHVVMSPDHRPRTEEGFISFGIKNTYLGIERFYDI